ncbi:unnamed protein product [Durusdinium trenchii]
MHEATSCLPVSLDLNHRKQLGTLSELWNIVSPFCSALEVLILSTDQLSGLAELLLNTSLEGDSDTVYLHIMSRLIRQLKCKRLAMCVKNRDDSTGLQTRWSLLTELDGDSVREHRSIPISHVPKDECGGGSAWAAGLIHALHVDSLTIPEALRRADLLSALSQNTEGDFSRVSIQELSAAEERQIPSSSTSLVHHISATSGPIVSVPSFAVDAAEVIEMTLKKMKDAKVLPIFRVKGDAQVAINRGVELASLGCKAMEVTMDSADWQLILSSLHQRLPDVILGVGTVMDDTVSQIPLAKSLGASFALSPIDPIGFIEVCKNLGVLAVPSAFTSNECWSMHRRGARLIKLFHAGLASPAILKAMLDVTPLGENLNILPSGSVSPGNASEWLKAGASIVGMGSNLVGKDISLKPGTAEFHAAVDDWRSKGRPIVEKMLKDLALLTP